MITTYSYINQTIKPEDAVRLTVSVEDNFRFLQHEIAFGSKCVIMRHGNGANQEMVEKFRSFVTGFLYGAGYL